MTTIRRARPEDARGIHEAHMSSIQEVCSQDHTKEEIAGWGFRPFREERVIAAIANNYVWVIEQAEKIEGYGELSIIEAEGTSRAHILGLYLRANVTGQGLGKQLLTLMLDEVKARGISEIGLESTITAHAFYKSFGFVDKGPQATAQIGGSTVRCQPMLLFTSTTQ
jgi:GNAT superfamily N-acetyltransferase